MSDGGKTHYVRNDLQSSKHCLLKSLRVKIHIKNERGRSIEMGSIVVSSALRLFAVKLANARVIDPQFEGRNEVLNFSERKPKFGSIYHEVK